MFPLGVMIFCLLVLWLVCAIRGIADDARARGNEPVPVVLLCLLCLPLGLLIGIVFRPETLDSDS